MTLEQLTALAQAGFTKQEIMSIYKPASHPNPNPAPTQASGTPTLAQAPAQAQAQAQAQVQAEAQGTVSENGVLNKLNELEKLLLMGNVGGSQMPEQTTADDMLAAIINPFDNK